MIRSRFLLLFFAFLFLSMLACQTLSGEPTAALPPPPTVVVNPAGTPLSVTATTIAGPVASPTATLPTLNGPALTAVVDVNVRGGPGVDYPADGFLLQGESAAIIGYDPTSGWWKVACPARSDGPECWVTGRTQYVLPVNTQNVPVAAVPPLPPTITPSATSVVALPTVPAGALSPLLVFVSNGNLFAMNLTISNDQAQAGQIVQLTNDGAVTWAALSPNGQKVAFIRQPFDFNEEILVINRDGTERTLLVNSANLPAAPDTNPAEVARLFNQVEWLPDGQTLAFNTVLVNMVGPGSGPTYDLWLVPAGGTPLERFAPGTGGGGFDISASNVAVMSTYNEVFRINLDGSGRQTLVTFEPVATYSEYSYIPNARWTADGSRILVAIPSQDPLQPTANTNLWVAPAGNNSQLLGNLLGNTLFYPVEWTANGNRLAYVKQISDPSNPPSELILADSNGGSQVSYATGNELNFIAWSPNENNFLYRGSGFYAIGQAGASPVLVNLAGGTSVGKGQWLTGNVYVVGVGTYGNWSLSSGNSAGQTSPLTTAATDGPPIFDVWTP